MNTTLDLHSLNDRRLVELHRAGDPAAFRQIVERYQGMVCALALSSGGDVARSEDVAQEVFLVAWRQLPGLREPEKLRGWLGGITRNLAHGALRRARRTPTAHAEPLDEQTAVAGGDPRAHAISAEEAALLWRTLEGIPELYREPMVLFYREQQSIPAVAATLEISEDLVRQRLVRGRALLNERMARLIEETLRRTAPTPAFALSVMLAVPVLTGPTLVVAESVLAQAPAGAAAKTLATAGGGAATLAKGGLVLKALGAVAALPALLNGLSDYWRFRADFEAAAAGDRRAVMTRHLQPLLLSAGFLSSVALFVLAPVPTAWAPVALMPLLVVSIYSARLERRRRRTAGGAPTAQPAAPVFEYRSRHGWLGLPWVHVRSGGGWRGKKAMGWIAVGDGVAIGGLFASAPLAVAPLSSGGVAVGFFALSGLALGLGALGAIAGGWWAAGGLAVAVHAAQGWCAVAHDLAAGGWAIAAHANDAAAKEYFAGSVFFRTAGLALRLMIWAAWFAWVPPLLLIGAHFWRRR